MARPLASAGVFARVSLLFYLCAWGGARAASASGNNDSVTLVETGHNTTLSPDGGYFEGQELRFFFDLGMKYTHTTNESNTTVDQDIPFLLELKAYSASPSIQPCATVAADANTAPLFESSELGSTTQLFNVSCSNVTCTDNETAIVFAAQATVRAPAHAAGEFYICFRYTITHENYTVDNNGSAVLNDTWTNAGGVEGVSSYSAPALAETWYHLPDATVGQYAIIQLLTAEARNFTYPPTACIGTASCADGDSLKIVARGEPCTYDVHPTSQDLYFGTNTVDANGHWTTDGYNGLKEGAQAGGVGAFGTQFANPLVEAWQAAGSYADVNDVYSNGKMYVAPAGGEGPGKHAYVYVRLPQVVAEFDVCFSSVEERAGLQNASTLATPVWRKLPRCTQPASCRAQQAAGAHGHHFAVAAEPVGWSMTDLTERTFGEIVFDDSGENHLSRARAEYTGLPWAAAFNPTPQTPTVRGDKTSYWAPVGGDFFILQPVGQFAESQTTGRTLTGTLSTSAAARVMGSPPSRGCWASTTVVDGVMNINPTETSRASTDLLDDPSGAAGLQNDATGVGAAYSPLPVPTEEAGSFFVCYRRTCGGVTANGCRAHTGHRVLPFHTSTRGSVPAHWLHLESDYIPGTRAGPAHALVAGRYPTAPDVPTALWYMNDTAEGSWGPVLVEKSFAATPVHLDSRAWTFRKTYTSGQTVIANTAGAAMRLVPSTFPCDYNQFYGTLGQQRAAESLDGGSLECDSWDATNNTVLCAGRHANYASARRVAHYVTVPRRGSLYRVCYRYHGFNWRSLSSVPAVRSADADALQPEPAWTLARLSPGPVQVFLTPTAPTVSIRAASVDDRTGGEVYYLIDDAANALTIAEGRGYCADGCQASGDVLRLVREGERCDITPTTWNATRDLQLTRTALRLYCPVDGSGTPETSGLLMPADITAATPCALSDFAETLCYSTDGCLASSPYLQGGVVNSPDIFDDLVPVASNVTNYTGGYSHAAVRVALPPPPEAANAGRYHVCYKRATSWHWTTLTTIQLRPALTFGMLFPPVNSTLLSGATQRFDLRVDLGTEPPQKVYAKFVQHERGRADLCAQPAADTDNAYGGASTNLFAYDAPAQRLTLNIPVPRNNAFFALCVLAVDADGKGGSTWWRVESPTEAIARVQDSFIRWFVRNGSRPVNGGVVRVNFVRCAITQGVLGADCREGATDDVFQLAPGADAAKVIPASSECSTGLHVDIGGGPTGVNGVTDLSPGDGIAGRAEVTVALPVSARDESLNYRVCVYTTPPGEYQTRRWFEIAQALPGVVPDQIYLEFDGASRFQTLPGLISSWTLAPELTPARSFYNAAWAPAVALAGASSLFVNASLTPDEDGNVADYTVRHGFGFAVSANAIAATRALLSANDDFKIVMRRRPLSPAPIEQNEPFTWGDAWTWTDTGASCLSDGIEDASNLGFERCNATRAVGAFTEAVCPHLVPPTDGFYAGIGENHTVHAVLHLPKEPGEYVVCWRGRGFTGGVGAPDEARPWQVVPAPPSVGGFSLYTHPTYLAADVVGKGANVTVRDSRVLQRPLPGSLVARGIHASSWCGVGAAPCDAKVQAFAGDLFTIVPHMRTCPAPASIAAGPAGAHAWYPLRLVHGSVDTVALDATAVGGSFSLLPSSPSDLSPSGLYKLCVFKAAAPVAVDTLSYAGDVITRSGVVYQVDVTAAEPGDVAGTHYWPDPNGRGRAVTLRVTSDIVYDPATHFISYSGDPVEMQATYGNESVVPRGALTHPVTGQVSHVPLLEGGGVVEYTVVAVNENGWAVPSEYFTVDVKRCRRAYNWESLECVDPVQEEPEEVGTFAVLGVGGACPPDEAPDYGWLDVGLRQATQAGTAIFRLQYTSSCPEGGFGCGLRFRGRGPTSVLTSTAQWVDTLRFEPDQVAVNERVLQGGVPPDPPRSITGCAAMLPGDRIRCYLLTCESGRACTLAVRARRHGELLYSAIGGIDIRYSTLDYGVYAIEDVPPDVANVVGASLSPAGVILSKKWDHGGQVEYTFTPMLQGRKLGVNDDAYVYLNVSTGVFNPENDKQLLRTRWARVVVRIIRPQLAGVRARDVAVTSFTGTALSGTGRAAPPAFSGSVNEEGDTLTAGSGSYLEALVPYTLDYDITEANGAMLPLIPGVLRDYTITGQIDASARLCLVLHAHDDYHDNFVTTPNKFEKFVVSGSDALLPYSLRFRVFVSDNTCSRFTALGGCRISFRFQSDITAKASTIALITPVRVPASTLIVSVVDGPKATTTMRDGLLIQVLPGSFVNTQFTAFQSQKIVYDDYHYGDVFALVDHVNPADPEATPYEDGQSPHDLYALPDPTAVVRDACAFPPEEGTYAASGRCAVYKYALSQLDGGLTTRWGARFVLRPSKPCVNCAFTFHSTWGAGPEAYERERDPQQAARLEGVTFVDEPMYLNCTTGITVKYPYGARHSVPFDVDVSAVVPGTGPDASPVSAIYPRLWVSADGRYPPDEVIIPSNTTFTFYRLRQMGQPYGIYQAWMGEGATATLKGLALRAPLPGTPTPGATEEVTVMIYAIANTYGVPREVADGDTRSLWSFAQELGAKKLMCGVKVTLDVERKPEKLPTTKALRVVDASGATAMCIGREAVYNATRRDDAVVNDGTAYDDDAPPPVRDCGDYVTTTEDLMRGITFDVQFVDASRVRDTPEARVWRNVTIVPAGGAASYPDAAVSWYYNATADAYYSNGLYLDSIYNAPQGTVLADQPYTFGGVYVAGVIPRRADANTTVFGGNASVTLKYGFGAVAGRTPLEFSMDREPPPVTPVRHARFRLCESLWVNATMDENNRPVAGYATTGTLCRTVNLWVQQSRPAAKLAVVSLTETETLRRGAGEACNGGEAAMISTIPYYMLPDGAVPPQPDTPSFGQGVTRADIIRALPSKRYFLYDTPLEYSVEIAAALPPTREAVRQRLVFADDAGFTAAFNTSLRKRSAVPLSTPGAPHVSLTHALGVSQLIVSFKFYGKDVFDVPSPIVLAAERLQPLPSATVVPPKIEPQAKRATRGLQQRAAGGANGSVPLDRPVLDDGPVEDGAIPRVMTTQRYTWRDADEAYLTWKVGGALVESEDCPIQRVLPQDLHHYQTFINNNEVPGSGWDTSVEVHVGIPSPVHTIVRTDTLKRAWSFADDTLVRVQKRTWSGCGDGGTLSVYGMRQAKPLESTVAVLGGADSFSIEGQMDTGWVDGVGNTAVYTSGGVAVPWVVFSSPCEMCTMQLDLCYPGRGPEECLDAGDHAATTGPTLIDGVPTEMNAAARAKSVTHPLRAERTKLTKPFRVVYPKLDLLQVVEQKFPHSSAGSDVGATGADPAVLVGEMFVVRVAGVQIYAKKWAMRESVARGQPQWVKRVWVTTEAGGGGDAGAAAAATSRSLRYGNGGFMGDAGDRVRQLEKYGTPLQSGCAAVLDAQEFLKAAVRAPVELGRNNELRFYFARPCAGCGVRIHYELSPAPRVRLQPTPGMHAATSTVIGSFPLRDYPAEVLRRPRGLASFRVETCGVGWVVSSRPSPSVRRRRAFSVTVVLVDVHESLATRRSDLEGFNGNFAGAPGVMAVPFQRLPGVGNGGGGEGGWVTSPHEVRRVTNAEEATSTALSKWTRPFTHPDTPRWVREFSGGVADVVDPATGMPADRWPGEVDPAEALTVRGDDGSATARLWYPRACYQCGVALGQSPAGRPNYYLFSVLTDPTRIIARPTHDASASSDSYNPINHAFAPSTWYFDVYVSDDNGDRAYEVGGPTEPAMRPQFRTPRIGARGADSAGMTAQARTPLSTPRVLVPAVDPIDPPIELTLNSGSAAMFDVTTGSTYHNGVPLPLARASLARGGESGRPGLLGISLSTPGVGYDVSFELLKDNPTSAGGERTRLPLPTYIQRGTVRAQGETVSLGLADVTSHFAVDDLSKPPPAADGDADGAPRRCTTTGNSRARPCYLEAYMIGSNRTAGIPNADQDVDVDDFWFRSDYDTPPSGRGGVLASVACCDGTRNAYQTQPMPFVAGKARLVIDAPIPKDTFMSTTCLCTIALVPPLSFPRARRATFSIEFTAEAVPDVWVPATSDTMRVYAAGGNSAAATATSVPGARVGIGFALAYGGTLMPYASPTLDTTGYPESAELLLWQQASVLLNPAQLSPPGCFVCETMSGDRCAVALTSRGTFATIYGSFPRGGRCSIEATAFSGFPTPRDFQGDVARGVSVEVATPSGIELHYNVTHPYSRRNAYFTGLVGRVADGGHPAAVIGVGAMLHIRVIDELERFLEGDYHATLTLRGRTASGQQSWVFEDGRDTFKAHNGVVSVHLDAASTTRTPECDAYTAAPADFTTRPWPPGHASHVTRAWLRQHGCPHDPWFFDITAVNATGGAIGEMKDLGPLYFVRGAAKFLAFASIGVECVEGGHTTATDAPPANATAATAASNGVELPRETCIAGADMGETNRTVAEVLNAGWRPLGVSTVYKTSETSDTRVFGMQALQEAGSVRHPAMWSAGSAFDVLVLAFDPRGRVLGHPEDHGSDAWLRFEGVDIPCRNVDTLDDGTYYGRTCLDTDGVIPLTDSCTYTPLSTVPTCTLANPLLPDTSPGQDVQLVAGVARVRHVQFSQDTTRGAPDGVSRFALEAVRGWPRRAPQSLLLEMYLHRGEGLQVVAREGVECNETARVCNITGMLAPAAGVTFGLDVAVTDANNLVVASDSSLRVAVLGECVSGEQAFLGVADGRPLPDYVRPPMVQARRGILELRNLLVSAACADFTLTLVCAGGAACGGLRLTLHHAVVPSDGSSSNPPTPAPAGGTARGYSNVDINGLVLDEVASVDAARAQIRNYKPLIMAGAIHAVLMASQLRVISNVTARVFCVFPRVDGQTFAISPFDADDLSVCTPAELLPVPEGAPFPLETQPTPEPTMGTATATKSADNATTTAATTTMTTTTGTDQGNTTGDSGNSGRRLAKVLQGLQLEPYMVFAWFDVETVIPVDAEVVSHAVQESLEADLAAETSILREASTAFAGASATTLAVGVPDTPIPRTAVPIPPTPLPPTPVPPTDIPTTPAPPTLVPPPAKGTPLTFPPRPRAIPAASGRVGDDRTLLRAMVAVTAAVAYALVW